MTSRLFLVLLLSLTLPGLARAGTADAEKRLRSAVDTVAVIAKDAKTNAGLAKSLEPVLTRYISFDAMTRRAVGPGWRQFTPAQQKEAVRLFSTLIIRTYSSKFTIGEDPTVTYETATEPAPGRVEIPTKLLYKGSRYAVIYRLEQAEGWRITDIVAEGVSLVANYRSQFDAQFKKGGAAAVISALNQSVATAQ